MTDELSSLTPRARPALAKPARDLDAGELRDVIREGVYRGVMKALAVYFLILAVLSLLVWAISQDL